MNHTEINSHKKNLSFEFLTENPLSFVTNTAFKDELFILLERYIKIGGL